MICRAGIKFALLSGCSLYIYNHFKNRNFLQRSALYEKTTILKPIICEEPSSLRLALLFFRHGRRTPILNKFALEEADWPKEWVESDLPETLFDYELANSILYPRLSSSSLDKLCQDMGTLKGGSGKGLLTIHGQRDLYELGQKFRKQYIEDAQLVPPLFDNQYVKPYSTNLSRTIKSMRCCLAGMFDKTSNTVATIYSRPNEFEYYFPNFTYCLRYSQFYNTALELEDQIVQFKQAREKVSKVLGKTPDQIPNLINLYEELVCLKGHGFSLPPEYEKVYQLISNVASEMMEYRLFDSRRLEPRLAVGFLFEDIAKYINEKIKNSSSHSLYLHSVHDTTLMAILKALDGYDKKWPDTSSYIAIELHQIKGNWFVRIIYNDKLVRLNSSEQTFTPLKEFFDAIQPYRLGELNFLQVCGRSIHQGFSKL